ncbi:MAG: hypothetical protein ACRD3L_09440 [Terriglobales bacterium]
MTTLRSRNLNPLLCAFVLAASSLCAGQHYIVTDLGKIADLGTLPGDDVSVAKALNASATVTGASASDFNDTSQVMIESDGHMTGLGTLGGSSGIGNSINASSKVAGYSTDASGAYHAFIAANGNMTDIGDLGGGSAVAYGINDLGQIVGSAVTASGENHPFLYSNGHMTDLGTLGSKNTDWWNVAQGINNSGEIVGTSYDADGNFFGFAWLNGKMHKLGTLGGAWSEAWAVNAKGQITGVAYTPTTTHAFITRGGRLTDLGTIPGSDASWGLAINNSGIVVGYCPFADTYHAFVYFGGKIRDLNQYLPRNSGWTLVFAEGINDANQIVGLGAIHGETHGFLLTPGKNN